MILGDFFKNLFKYLFLSILCLVPIVLLGAGVYCGLELYREKTSVSQTFGTLKEHDLWEEFNIFDCDLSDAIFYQVDAGGYEYTATIPKAVDFDGSKHKYNVLINENPSNAEQSSAGILTATNTLNYYNVEGNVLQQTILNIEVRFYQSKLQLSISTTNNADQQALFLEYIRFNGLRMRIIEAQYVPNISVSEYYTITFLGKDGELLASNKVASGAIISVPKAPDYVGYVFDSWSPAVPTFATKHQTFTAIYVSDSPYVQLLVDGAIKKKISQNFVTSSISDYDLTLGDVYPVVQVADGAGNYFCYDPHLTKGTLQDSYNLIGTQTGDSLAVTFGSQTQTFSISSGITFVIELFDLDTGYKSDKFFYEFEY